MDKKHLFGTSGIRGDAQKDLTNQFCFDIAIAFSKFLENHDQKGPFAIGKDPRESSPRIANAIISGLQFSNHVVFDQGVCPVPAINSILKTSDIIASIMVTGSHINANLNGLKFFFLKEEILKEHEAEIEEIYFKIKGKYEFKEKTTNPIEEDKANKDYLEMLLSFGRPPYPDWKVVIDCSNGCQSVIIPNLFTILDINTIFMNTNIQGNFIARDTETQDAVIDLSQRVKKEKADFGIAFDPDGDRVVFVDSQGDFIPGDVTGSIIAKNSPDVEKIITPINTSQVVETLGKPVIRTKVGSPYVVQAIKENNEAFGFEANGGGIFKKGVMSRDGGMTAVTLLNVLKETKKTLKELVDSFPKLYLFRLKVDCPSFLNDKILKRAEKEFKPKKIEKLDGLKLWLDSSTWLLFRPSSNAPEFRVFAESNSLKKAKSLSEKGILFVKNIIKENEKK
jgi:phosphomannomutase / phosphoglucomutase